MKVLSDHLSDKHSAMGQFANSHRRAHHEGESISEYGDVMQNLYQMRDFGNALDEALRDCFFLWLLREDTQPGLFTKDNKLTPQNAVHRAQAMEAEKKSAAEIQAADASVTDAQIVTGG